MMIEIVMGKREIGIGGIDVDIGRIGTVIEMSALDYLMVV